MSDLERYETPIVTDQPLPRIISRRLYNAVLAGLVVLSFAVMAACSYITSTADFIIFVARNPILYTVVSLAASIVGIVVMSVGRSKESLVLGGVGYALFTLSFGFTTSFALSAYSLESLSTAFAATAAIMVVFGLAGFMFPRFFAKIQGVLCVALLAIVAVELVLMFMGVGQNITDIAVILIFCGFIGYDVYQSQMVAPTLTNALWFAVDLYLDIVNVLLRLLSIFGNRE